MNIEYFITKLKSIMDEHGGDLEIIMADNVPVIDPVCSDKYPGGKKVVITDQV